MNLNNYYILTIICIILKDNGIFIIFIEEDLNKIYDYMYIYIYIFIYLCITFLC